MEAQATAAMTEQAEDIPSREDIEKEVQYWTGVRIWQALNGGVDLEKMAPWVGHAMRWSDGAGQKKVAGDENPYKAAVLDVLARRNAATADLPHLSEDDDAATQ